MPQTTRYWLPSTGNYAAVQAPAAGISVITADTDIYVADYEYGAWVANFEQAVHACLRAINATPSGHAMLVEMENIRTQNAAKAVTIVAHPRSNNASAGNGLSSQLTFVQEIKGGGAMGVATNAALTLAATAAGQGASAATTGAWLAGVINNTPRYSIFGRPGHSGSDYKAWMQSLRDVANAWLRWSGRDVGYFNQEMYGGGPVTPQAYDIGITGAQVQQWMGGAPLSGIVADAGKRLHAILSTIVALYPHGVAGPGVGSAVRFCADPDSEMNQERPPAIGLAHELIHAYWSLKGMQPGDEFAGPDSTTILFEYRCVGIGPWDEVAPSENSIRAQWVSHAYATMANGDPLYARNHRDPGKRIAYEPNAHL